MTTPKRKLTPRAPRTVWVTYDFETGLPQRSFPTRKEALAFANKRELVAGPFHLAERARER